jgi:hypothetical protein
MGTRENSSCLLEEGWGVGLKRVGDEGSSNGSWEGNITEGCWMILMSDRVVDRIAEQLD